jgi:hypothetical protein
MIGRGERLVLTGYDDVLHVRLEWERSDRRIDRRIAWIALENAVVGGNELLAQLIADMREKLAMPPRSIL